MNNLQIFTNSEFGKVRTITTNDNKILFCASDIAKALGYSNPNKAINDHCRAITKQNTPISGKIQEINFIPEGDIYRLIVRSKLPSAENFEKWVFDEVLPSIRKTGGYIPQTEQDTPEEIMAKALMIAQNTLALREERIKNLENKIEEDKPLVSFADRVLKDGDNILVRELAKIITDEGYKIGQNRLYEKLREWGYICKNSTEPTQRAMEQNYFVVETRIINTPYGTKQIFTSYVTPRGQIKIVEKVIENLSKEKNNE
jgi:anti-repressor protein